MIHRVTSLFSMLSSIVGLSCFATAAAAQTPLKIPDALTVIHNRKSVRTYLDKPVTKEQIEILLRAGMAAPTAADKRPWVFVAVTDRAVLDKLSNTSQYSKMLTKAGAAIIVCGDTRKGLKSDVWVQDCSAASENILLAAEAIGLGAVWCGFISTKGRQPM